MTLPTLTPALTAQINQMIERHEDYVIDAEGVGVDYVVVNLFGEGVWLMAHHDTCVMDRWTRIARLR